MKNILKIIMTIVLVIFLIYISPLIKDVVLYFKYEYDKTYLIKSDKIDSLSGLWTGIFDNFENGHDFRLKYYLNVNSDSTGLLLIDSYSERIDGSFATHYSWSSLLPFSGEYKSFFYSVAFDDSWITCRSDDPLYAVTFIKYKRNCDTLYITDN